MKKPKGEKLGENKDYSYILVIGIDSTDLVENTKLASSGFTVLKISQIRVKNFHMQIIFVYAQTFVSAMNSK